MSKKNILNYFDKLITFIVIFSFVNDNFLVEYLGKHILKLILILFIVINLKKNISFLKSMNSIGDKLFFLWYFLLSITFLIQILLNKIPDLLPPFYLLIYIIAIVPYFRSFDLNISLYFFWFSMIISVIICYFSDPISEWTFRTSGGTKDPNEFATQLLIFIFVSLHFFKKKKNVFFIIVSIVFFLYGFFRAGSMSAFLVLGLIAFLIIGKYRSIIFKRLMDIRGIVLICLFILSLWLINPFKVEAVINVLNRTKDNHTSEKRMNSWVAGFNMILDNPIFGVGLDNYVNYTRDYSEVAMTDDSLAAHNLYIELAAESGLIVGVALLLLISLLTIKNLNNMEYYWIWLAWLSILMMGLTLGLIYDKYFIYMIAINMNIYNLSKKDYI